MARRGGTRLQRWRVPLGFACAAVFLVLARPTLKGLLAGGAVALVGLGVRAWSAGHIRKNAALAVSGPYAYTRNPLYFGSFVLGLGFTVAASNGPALFLLLGGLFALLFFGIYLPVMRVEAKTLEELFGDEYRAYAAAVPLLLPRFTPYRPAGASKTTTAPRFDPSLYMRYREYRAGLGLLVAWGVLVVKAVLAFPN